ncbi:LysM peptidoglycan-binding domain-containing protein [Pseudoalteromonas sp. T1lg24]|uniref:LysM peptidoglycan-binding domain-containing protein n=1 Tax=Pseudoalteromonas sp. T1lg24 TaxID=2077099 RepID=UPI000CF5DF62|nr:LysM domain-containing protein [Pseudoalteromonas sp. T1lg24]
MVKKLTAAIVALTMAFPTLADVLQIRKDAPKEYVVEKGDTLWDISAIYLDQPWLWPELWRLNPQIDNPHLIYPGDKLSLVYDSQGRPMLVINQKFKRLSPGVRKTMKKGDAIPTLPLEVIRPFLTYEQALDKEDIDARPVVLGANHSVKNMKTDHIIYVKGNLERSQYYGIYRQGDPYIDPDTDEVLGHEAILVGTGRAFRTGDEASAVPASVRVKNVKREVRQGDFLMPALEGQTLPAFFMMQRPDSAISGTIIDTTSKLREFSTMDVVVINRGEVNSLKPGHILDIRRASPTVVVGKDGPKYKDSASRYERAMSIFGDGEDSREWEMPKEKVGELMVFKVYDKVSYAIVTKTLEPVRVGDTIHVDN